MNLTVASLSGNRTWSAAAGPCEATHAADPPAPSDPFFIASIAKRFVVTLLLQAYERGEVPLDESITELLPTDLVVLVPRADALMAGTVDQVKGQAVPFRIMLRCLRAWSSDRTPTNARKRQSRRSAN